MRLKHIGNLFAAVIVSSAFMRCAVEPPPIQKSDKSGTGAAKIIQPAAADSKKMSDASQQNKSGAMQGSNPVPGGSVPVGSTEPGGGMASVPISTSPIGSSGGSSEPVQPPALPSTNAYVPPGPAPIFPRVVPSSAKPVFSPTAFLKNYAQGTEVCTVVSYGDASGVIIGSQKDLNRAEIKKHFNCVQPVLYPAWDGFWSNTKPVSPSEIYFQTQKFNDMVNWGVSEGYSVTQHMLLGRNLYFPKWFSESNYTALELDSILEKYIKTLMESNQNSSKVGVWNVLHEVLGSQGGYCVDGNSESNCKWAKMGMEADKSGLTGADKIVTEHPVFIKRALQYAAKYTNGKLEIRDINVDFDTISAFDANNNMVRIKNRKSATLYQLIKHLQASSVRIDAVGFYSNLNHATDNFHVPYDFADFEKNVAKFKSLGVDVYLSGLDVGLRWDETEAKADGTRAPIASVDWTRVKAEQPTTYYDVVRASRRAGVSVIGVWGFRDTSVTTRIGEQALILNSDYSRKPAYTRFLEALFSTWRE
jgi:GH35 family endo-1,4-beta-xylanase